MGERSTWHEPLCYGGQTSRETTVYSTRVFIRDGSKEAESSLGREASGRLSRVRRTTDISMLSSRSPRHGYRADGILASAKIDAALAELKKK